MENKQNGHSVALRGQADRSEALPARFAIVRGYIVTANLNGSIPLGSRIVAKVEGAFCSELVRRANSQPELLEALRSLVSAWDSIPEDTQVPDQINDNQWDAARTALARAKGAA